MKKQVLSLLLAGVCLAGLIPQVSAQDMIAEPPAPQTVTKVYGTVPEEIDKTKPVVIVLDPGHGGSAPGTTIASDREIIEKEITLKTAQYTKEELEKYKNVSVYLTRDTDTNPDMEARAKTAKDHNATVLISQHFNSTTTPEPNGAEVWESVLEEFKLTVLGQKILAELSRLGLKNLGVKARPSESGDKWTDDVRLADYYGLIRQSAYQNIPALIIEHCFLSNQEDLAYASSEEALKKLGQADATALAEYFDLERIPDYNLANALVDDIPDQPAGSLPEPVVRDGRVPLIKDRDYTLAYSTAGNTTAITITGVGSYHGTQTVSYQTAPEAGAAAYYTVSFYNTAGTLVNAALIQETGENAAITKAQNLFTDSSVKARLFAWSADNALLRITTVEKN